MIYLDNAATSFPKPDCVIDAMVRAQKYIGANPGRGGHKKTVIAGQQLFLTRQAVADFFGAESENVIFTSNCTHSLNVAIKGTVKKGDEVIISSLEHNSVLRPVHKLKMQGIIDYRVASVYPESEEKTLQSFRDAITDRTRLIVCTCVSNVFGTRLPFEKIGRLCKEKNLIFIADAAQCAGMEKIDIKKCNIDILCAPGHKGLMGPMGTGIIVFKDPSVCESLFQGGTGSNSMQPEQPEFPPDNFETGTANLPGIMGLYQGISFIGKIGGEKAISEKENYLCSMIVNSLHAIKGVRIYDEMTRWHPSSIVAFNVKNLHSEQVAELADKSCIALRAGYHCSFLAHSIYGTDQTGVVRVSPGFFNTKKDVNSLINCVNKIAKDHIL